MIYDPAPLPRLSRGTAAPPSSSRTITTGTTQAGSVPPASAPGSTGSAVVAADVGSDERFPLGVPAAGSGTDEPEDDGEAGVVSVGGAAGDSVDGSADGLPLGLVDGAVEGCPSG